MIFFLKSLITRHNAFIIAISTHMAFYIFFFLLCFYFFVTANCVGKLSPMRPDGRRPSPLWCRRFLLLFLWHHLLLAYIAPQNLSLERMSRVRVHRWYSKQHVSSFKSLGVKKNDSQIWRLGFELVYLLDLTDSVRTT